MSYLFTPSAIAPLEASKIPPRPYQREALAALDNHMRTKKNNPCVVLPTGSGKSLVIAWAIQGWKHDFPGFRCVVLAHRKELVEQNANEMHALWPGGDIGIYSAGLRRRDTDASVMFASIDSVYERWGEFPPFHVVLIDEAHRIPARGEGKYRSFIAGARSQSPDLRVIGFTATPFRLGMGPICHADHVLNEVCYEAPVAELIRDGYLCGLRSKVSVLTPDLADVRKNTSGDYVENSLARVMEAPAVVQSAVREAALAIKSEGRKSAVFFCVDVKHCQAVSHELRRYDIYAPIVVDSTPDGERRRIAEDFKAGRLQAICNVNVFTEGFNAQRVDTVALLRPTMSPALYIQMVGRGLRKHPSKTDCLVLDFARAIETHGPIDCLEAGRVRVIVCGSVATKVDEGEPQPPSCGDTFSRVIGACPHCGWKIPPAEIKREADELAAEKERQLHEAKASERSILGSEPETVDVEGVTLHRHRKNGMPDSLRVLYRFGTATASEWVHVDHEGLARKKALRWLVDRFGAAEAGQLTLDKILDDLFAEQHVQKITKQITVVRRGRYLDVVGHKLEWDLPGGASGDLA